MIEEENLRKALDRSLTCNEMVLLQNLLKKVLKRHQSSIGSPPYWQEQKKKFLEVVESLDNSEVLEMPEVKDILGRFDRNVSASEKHYSSILLVYKLWQACKEITGDRSL